MLDNINSVQKALLHKLGLTEQIYKKEILPKLLLTLDRKRLSDEDKIQIDDIVLLHCTSAQNRKFKKAILARIVKIMKSRDGANRVVEVEYFKETIANLKAKNSKVNQQELLEVSNHFPD